MDRFDADRLKLLDRLDERVPELDLDREQIEWRTLDDGHEALLVNGGGFDGGDGAFFANSGEDVHVVGSLSPLIAGHIGCIGDRAVAARRRKKAGVERTGRARYVGSSAGSSLKVRRKSRS